MSDSPKIFAVCKRCRERLSTSASNAGKTLNCPNCQSAIEFPTQPEQITEYPTVGSKLSGWAILILAALLLPISNFWIYSAFFNYENRLRWGMTTSYESVVQSLLGSILLMLLLVVIQLHRIITRLDKNQTNGFSRYKQN